MHRCPGHENEDAPCNMYCDGQTHMDIVYTRQSVVNTFHGDVLAAFQYHISYMGEHICICSVTPCYEVPDVHRYYPQSAQHFRLTNDLAYRVTYTLHAYEDTL